MKKRGKHGKGRRARRPLSKKERLTRRIVGPLQYDRIVYKYGLAAKIAAEKYAEKIKPARKAEAPKGRTLKLKAARFRREKVPRVHFEKVGKKYLRIETTAKGKEKIRQTTLRSIRRTEGKLKYWGRIGRISDALGVTKKQAREIDTEVLRDRIKAFEAFKKTKKYKNMTKAQKRRWTKARIAKQAKRGLDALAGLY